MTGPETHGERVTRALKEAPSCPMSNAPCRQRCTKPLDIAVGSTFCARWVEARQAEGIQRQSNPKEKQ